MLGTRFDLPGLRGLTNDTSANIDALLATRLEELRQRAASTGMGVLLPTLEAAVEDRPLQEALAPTSVAR